MRLACAGAALSAGGERLHFWRRQVWGQRAECVRAWARARVAGPSSGTTGISKGRFVHHTSFLWDYDPRNMRVLAFPDKVPAYRKGRAHDAFLTTLRETTDLGSVDEVLDAIEGALEDRFDVERVDGGDSSLAEALRSPHRQATVVEPLHL